MEQARYDLASRGTLRLLPPEARLAALRRDYGAMADMIFGKPPASGQLLERLATLEG